MCRLIRFLVGNQTSIRISEFRLCLFCCDSSLWPSLPMFRRPSQGYGCRSWCLVSSSLPSTGLTIMTGSAGIRLSTEHTHALGSAAQESRVKTSPGGQGGLDWQWMVQRDLASRVPLLLRERAGVIGPRGVSGSRYNPSASGARATGGGLRRFNCPMSDRNPHWPHRRPSAEVAGQLGSHWERSCSTLRSQKKF